MIDQTITQLRQMKLTGMASALVSQVEQPGNYEGLAFEQRLQSTENHIQTGLADSR